MEFEVVFALEMKAPSEEGLSPHLTSLSLTARPQQ